VGHLDAASSTESTENKCEYQWRKHTCNGVPVRHHLHSEFNPKAAWAPLVLGDLIV
jgi:hypothetical protein